MLPVGTRTRLAAFRALETLSDLRGNAASPIAEPPLGPARDAWWVFASTIGELNGTAPLLDALGAQLAHLQLVLITDHPHYREAYLARFPDAEVVVSRGHSQDADALAARRPPKLALVAEIPLLPSDAPCRCSASLLLRARQAGARLAVVNGWLYHQAPPSRMDRVEKRLLGQALLGQFDAICVQTPAAGGRMERAGAPVGRIHVVGNLKLDALVAPTPETPARSPALSASIRGSARPVVVGGSLRRPEETALLLDAFVALRATHGLALLVVAPRHPEVAQNLQRLDALLAERGLAAARRSGLVDDRLPEGTDVLVLDTIGELRDLYRLARVAHIGVDHNVLEPLRAGCVTTVVPGWDTTYPSYPVYRQLADAGVLHHGADAAALSAVWQAALDGRVMAALDRLDDAPRPNETSLQRHLRALGPLIEAARGGAAPRHH